MTATVETVSEQLDLTSIIPSDRVGSAVARSVTVSEADVGRFLGFLRKNLSLIWTYLKSKRHSPIGQTDYYWNEWIRNSRDSKWEWRRGWWRHLAYICREVQIHSGFVAPTTSVYSSITHSKMVSQFLNIFRKPFFFYLGNTNCSKVRYTILHDSVFECVGSSWRCSYKSCKRSKRFLYLVPRESVDQEVSILYWFLN